MKYDFTGFKTMLFLTVLPLLSGCKKSLSSLTTNRTSTRSERLSARSVYPEYQDLMQSSDYKALSSKSISDEATIQAHATRLACQVKKFEQLLTIYQIPERHMRLYRFKVSDIKKEIATACKHPQNYIKRNR